jgi:hypothetical protein
MSEITPENKKNEGRQRGNLMWDCFVNWSATLEKIDKGLIKEEKDA